MSAIFGIIYKDGKPVEDSEINAIKNAISPPATDGSRVHLNGNVALGHCRLYVHPKQQFENQPYSSGGLDITADARIDNRSELSKRLALDHQRFLEISDDQLILLAYRKWGNACVDYLEGEYAFAIWDQSNQQLFAAVDQIGFRPFFYYDAPDVFIFCSEIKGVEAAKKTPNYFEEESLIEYFYRKGMPYKTYNKEIFALCGSNTLTLADGKVSAKKYWELKSTGKYHFTNDSDWYECTRELLYRAVEKRLNPDVPTGITLSGGLDSTSLACILSELLLKKNKPLYAFSSVLPVDYKGIEKDERQYIEIVGKHCPNIIQTYIEAPGVGPLSNLERAFELEETFPNSFFYMDRAIVEAAAEQNVRNLFTGFGGDFWISNRGNNAIYFLIRQGHYKSALNLLRQFSENEQDSLIHEFRIQYLSKTEAYKRLRSLIRQEESELSWKKNSFLRDDILEKYSTRLHETEITQAVSAEMKHTIETGRISRILYMLYNRNSNFKMGSAVPIFDKTLMEFLFDVPERLLVENGRPRNLLRSSVKQIIPQQIYNRTDKLPYSPGFPGRILRGKSQFEKIAADADTSTHRQFVKSEEIMRHFAEIKPFTGFSPPMGVVDLRTAHAGIACYLLDYLCATGYDMRR